MVLGHIIPRSVKVSEAPGFGQTVLSYDPHSRGAGAYLDAVTEFATRGDYLPVDSTGPIGVSPETARRLAAESES